MADNTSKLDMNIMSIKEFTSELNKRGLAPKNIEFSKWHNWTIVNTFDVKDMSFISEAGSTGIDKNPELALLKSLSEFCERQVFRTSDQLAAKATIRSDGFAAYPAKNSNSKILARDNAYNEAIERYLWATWWDNEAVAYISKEAGFDEMENIKNEFGLESVKHLTIKASNSTVELTILLAKKLNGGFVTGGAAAKAGDENAYKRAFGELLRHLFVVQRIERSAPREMSFYEQRLWGFASGNWNDLVLARLQTLGQENIVLPSLIIDEEIVHKDSEFIIVHRCLFKDQPVFMGGRLERLCI